MKKPPPSHSVVSFATFSVAVFFLFSFLFSFSAQSQNEPLGLALSIDAGMLMPNAKQASFYDGRPGRPNTIYRVLHSQAYGTEIWTRLKDGGYITDAVGNYNNLQVEEWPSMYYKNAFQLGFGLRYGYSGGWGWMLRVDYSRLTAAGEWLLSSANGTGILTDNRYVRCGMMGIENRIIIDVALTKQIMLDESWALDLEAGFSFNNTKVKEQQMEIAGGNYSILDIWDGNSPYSGIGTYEYVNQGGLGYGGFGTLAFSYVIPGYGSLDVGYSCYYTQTHFPGFNDDDAFALQHLIFVRATIYNFLF